EHLLSFINLFDQLVKEKSGNEFHLWTVTGKRMVGKSLLALAYAKDGNNKESLDFIESITAEISTQTRLYYEHSVEILYNIGEVYRILGKIDKSKLYFEDAIIEMNRIADMLNDEDRNLFFNNIKIHKTLKGLAS
ncbi:uncharacterized protein METZ01_LOCUS271895, partial [marine metagenome]